jgi:hypothetical protein
MNKKNIAIVFCMLIFLLIICISINCYSIKEGLDNSDSTDIPADGIIPDGYYKLDETKMKKIPYGYTTNTEKTELLPNTQSAFWVNEVKKKDNVMDDPILNSKKYNTDNYDLLYHDSEESIKYQSGLYGSDFGTTMVLDNCGNKVLIPYNETQGYPIYYKPGSYKYGASTYIPNYEDSVLLSRDNINKLSFPSKIIKNNSSEKKYQKNVVYLKPQFISLSTYVPNNAETIYSSKTSGIDTTSVYNCK